MNERAALTAALAAVALWSTVATGFKLGLQTLAPVQLLTLGTAVSTAVFWLAAAYRRQWRLSTRQLLWAAGFGIVNPCTYYLVLFEAYDRLPAQIAQPLNYTWAIVLAVLAVPVLGHRLTARTLGGIALGYAGVVILLSQGRVDGLAGLSVSGVVLALISTLLWALYWLLKTRVDAPSIGLMAWSFGFALPVIATLCAIGPGLPSLTWRNAAFGAWVGLVEMGVTFLLWQRALRLTADAGRIGQLIFLSPFVSLVLIGTVLGEAIQPSSIAGLAAIVAGLLLTRR